MTAPEGFCPRCKNRTAQGHETNYCRVHGANGRLGEAFIPRHMCCPGSCELDYPEDLQASIDFWKAKEIERGQDFEFIYEFTEKVLKFSLELQDGLDNDDARSV